VTRHTKQAILVSVIILCVLLGAVGAFAFREGIRCGYWWAKLTYFEEEPVKLHLVRQLFAKESGFFLKLSLTDESPLVRRHAAHYAGRLTYRPAIGRLAAMLEGDGDDLARRYALRALVEIGDDSVEPLLVCLKSPKGEVRRLAIVGLGLLGAEEAVGPLIELMEEEDETPADPAEILENPAPATEALIRIGKPAVPDLAALLHHTKDTLAARACYALGEIQDGRAAPALIGMLAHGSADIRRRALDALMKLGDHAREALIEALERKNKTVRLRAAAVLAQVKCGGLAFLRFVDDRAWRCQTSELACAAIYGRRKVCEFADDAHALESLKKAAERRRAFTAKITRPSAAVVLESMAPALGVKKRLVKRYGGSASFSAVDMGLKWLKRHQAKDGSWGSQSFAGLCKNEHSLCAKGKGTLPDKITSPALTALAMTCFLNTGYTHKTSRYRRVMGKAVEYLLDKQQKDGTWITEHEGTRYYATPLCTLALAEAYGMTRDKRLKPPLEKAVAAILKKVTERPFRWEESNIIHESPDAVNILTVSALKDAKLCGIPGDYNRAFKVIKEYFKKHNAGKHKGIAKNNSAAMTAEIALAHSLMGMKRTDPTMKESITFITKTGPAFALGGRVTGGRGMPFVAAGTWAVWQHGGREWKAWNKAMKQTVITTQIKGGCADGSWPAANGFEIPGYVHKLEKKYGAVYTSCLATLTLTVYYRSRYFFR